MNFELCFKISEVTLCCMKLYSFLYHLRLYMHVFLDSHIKTICYLIPRWLNYCFQMISLASKHVLILFFACYFQHKYHTKIDDLIEKTLVSMKSGLVGKLTSVLKSVLEKLSRYDEGTVFGSILSSLVNQ